MQCGILRVGTIEGISFAIPMDDVVGMLDDLKEFDAAEFAGGLFE